MNDHVDWLKVCAGCHDCCGPVPFSIGFLKAHKAKMQCFDNKYLNSTEPGYFIPVPTDGYCVFVDRATDLCLVYRDRPKVCRLYGRIPDLPCHKLNPELHTKQMKVIDKALNACKGTVLPGTAADK